MEVGVDPVTLGQLSFLGSRGLTAPQMADVLHVSVMFEVSNFRMARAIIV